MHIYMYRKKIHTRVILYKYSVVFFFSQNKLES